MNILFVVCVVVAAGAGFWIGFVLGCSYEEKRSGR